MKSMVSLTLSFLLCYICSAQHISEFTSLDPTGQSSDFSLPSTHTFQYIIQNGDPLESGGSMPDVLDFTGYVPRAGSSKYGYLSINSEDVPGAVTILDIEFDDEQGMWIVDDSVPVDFDFGLILAGTAANCSGTVTPWNTIITCEEVTNKDINVSYPIIPEIAIKVDGDINGYDGYGWAIEIDPATKKVIDQDDSRDGPDKLWAMGNYKHENAAVHQNLRTVYQGADDWLYDEGYLFKFVADVEKKLASGVLYVYKETSSSGGDWILIPNTTIEERNSTLINCLAVGATSFDGIEDVEINPIDGTIHFAVKGDGRVYQFNDSDPITGTKVTNFKTYVGGMSYEVKPGTTEPWGTGNDNLVFDDLGNLWVAQDGSFSGGDSNYIWLVENGHTQANPKVKIFGRTPTGSEPTGLTFTPDYKYIFMSIQHPNSANSSTSQFDALGRSVDFDKDITIVLARNDHLGQNLSTGDQDVMITQYYEDEATGSKWVEVKNISGKAISEGTYFLDLFDESSLGNIASASPKHSEAIPALAKDEVVLFKNSANPSFPQNGHLGNAQQIVSNVCDFDGDDVLLITTTPGSRKYTNRKDVIGSIPASQWGKDVSLTKGGNYSSHPSRTFDPNDWFEFTDLDEVNLAESTQNIALGTYMEGDAIWNGSSWNNDSPPDRTRIVEIDGAYQSASDNLKVFDLIVNDGASLIFKDDQEGRNNSIMVYQDLIVHSNASLLIGDTESLIIKNTAAVISGEITKVDKSAFRNHTNDMTYWSSPVLEGHIEDVFVNVNPDRIFFYDQSKYVSPETYWKVWENQSSGDMIPGKGYAAEGHIGTSGIHELSFTGIPNHGIIRVSDVIFNNDSGANEDKDNDFNLIGNPYPAAIDIEAFLEENTELNPVIDGTVYLWTHANAASGGEFTQDDYITYNFVGASGTDENVEVTRNIGSAQGFFVRAIKSDDIIFDPSMILESSNDQFFKEVQKKKESERNRIWLNLKAADHSFKQILIGFDEKASDGLDIGYDALYLKGNQAVDFYSLLENEKLAIQGLGALTEEKKVKIGVETLIDDLEVTIEIGKKDGALNEQQVFLLDQETGVLHDLDKAPYTFIINDKGVLNDRFSLLFNSTVLAIDPEVEVEQYKIYVKNEQLIVDSPELIRELKLYDSLGRLIEHEYPTSKYYELYLEHLSKGGLYIVELINDSGKSFTKKMLFY